MSIIQVGVSWRLFKSCLFTKEQDGVLCDDDDDLCTRVVERVRGLQVDSSLDVRVWSLIASKTRNELKSGLYPSRDLTAFHFRKLAKERASYIFAAPKNLHMGSCFCPLCLFFDHPKQVS